jgi:23S rRNA (uracil1939-C5)-methyltransferase
MVERGRENALRAEITNATFMAADLANTSENRLYQTCGKIDVVLLDPPRDGAKEIIAKLPQLSPKRIVYVSCNPATLARDAKVLAEAGYQLDSLGVMDMFPHTAHVESIAVFEKGD